MMMENGRRVILMCLRVSQFVGCRYLHTRTPRTGSMITKAFKESNSWLATLKLADGTFSDKSPFQKREQNGAMRLMMTTTESIALGVSGKCALKTLSWLK